MGNTATTTRVGMLGLVTALILLLTDVLVGSLGAAVELGGSPAGLAVVAAAALLTLLILHRAVPAPTACGALVASAVRQRATRTAFLPLRDPDSRGRTRPRAPSLAARAA